MPKKGKKGYVWVRVPKKVTFTPQEKSKLLKQLEEFIETSNKLKDKVSSWRIHGSHLYLYEHMETNEPEYEGEYFKLNYARITFTDKSGENCTADWQRHNEQWIEFHRGSFIECLKFIDDGGGFFGN